MVAEVQKLDYGVPRKTVARLLSTPVDMGNDHARTYLVQAIKWRDQKLFMWLLCTVGVCPQRGEIVNGKYTSPIYCVLYADWGPLSQMQCSMRKLLWDSGVHPDVSVFSVRFSKPVAHWRAWQARQHRRLWLAICA
jgi:hypothetical protein